MGRLIDYTGKRFGILTVVERAGTKVRGINKTVKTPLWRCLCDCGNDCCVTSAELRRGDTRSCGCLAIKTLRERSTTHGDGHSGSEYYRLYHIWHQMIRRCENKKDSAYKDYGERGIYVCKEWHDYLSFKEWSLSHGYKNDLTIDRINNNDGYTPYNCRWADYSTQARNRRSCRYITINGEKKTITEWCEINHVSPFTAYSRIDLFNWNPQKAVSFQHAKKHYYKNVQEVD